MATHLGFDKDFQVKSYFVVQKNLTLSKTHFQLNFGPLLLETYSSPKMAMASSTDAPWQIMA